MTERTVIHVGQNAPAFSAFGDFLDGKRAVIRRCQIAIREQPAPATLLIVGPDKAVTEWALPDVRRVPDQADASTLVLADKDDPVARLHITDKEAQAVLSARCPNLKNRPLTRGKGRLVAWSAAAMASVALIIFVLVPIMADQLAEYLPVEGEKALGDSTFEQIRTALGGNQFEPIELCENPAGTAALAKMQARLEEQINLPYPLTVHVLDDGLINAFALPGGRIVFFRGLIDEAEHPDEVAAVFAHEIGHVVNRDPTRGALRSAGSIGVLGLVFGDFAGGAAVLFLANQLIEANYSQAAEAGADVFAHEKLNDAGIPPSALGSMFERLREKYGEEDGIVAHFLSHPKLGDRIEAANLAAENMDGPIRPSLDEQDWQDLRNICQ